jgi:hypothetical protein
VRQKNKESNSKTFAKETERVGEVTGKQALSITKHKPIWQACGLGD